MDNDICAVLDRSYEIWSSECAVNEKWDIVCVCDICNSFDINYVWVRVAKSFDIESLCVLLDSLFKVSWVKRIDKCCCDAVINKSVCKQVICAAIDVLCSYDMIACKGYVLDSVCYCCCAWCNCKSCCAALESCDTSFKNVLSWVCKSAIDVACVLKSKSVSGMLWVMENVWWCLINRNSSCVCYRVCCFLTNVELKCFKFKISFVYCAHFKLPLSLNWCFLNPIKIFCYWTFCWF